MNLLKPRLKAIKTVKNIPVSRLSKRLDKPIYYKNRKTNFFLKTTEKQFLCIFICINFFCFSQEQNILKGTICNQKNNMPVANVNVYLSESLEGSITDDNGYFEILTTRKKATLNASCIGYVPFTKLFILNNKTNLKIFIEEENIALDEVILRSTNSFTLQTQKGWNNTKINKIETLQTPGSQADIFKSLQNMEGVSILDDNATLFVRGGNFDETITLIDGAYLFNPFKFNSPVGGFFGTISPFTTKKNYFSNGGYSSRYGNAISGLISLESEDFTNSHSIELTLALSNISAKYTVPIIENQLSISIFGNYINTKGLFSINKPLINFKKHPVSHDINILVNHEFTKKLKLKLHYFQNDDKTISESQYFEESNVFVSTHNKQRFFNLSSKHTSPQLKTSFNISYNTFKGDASIHSENDEYELGKHNNNKNNIFQTNLRFQVKLRRNLYNSFGVEFVKFIEKIESNFLFSLVADNRQLENQITNSNYINYHSNRIAVFKDLIFNHSNQQFLLGVRLESDSQSEKYFLNIRSNYNWKITDNYNLNVSVGQYNQYADTDFYATNKKTTLGSISAVHYLLGFSYRNDRRSITGSAYYKDYTKLILNNDANYYTNNGYGFAKGIDFSYKEVFVKHTFKVSMSYLDAKRKWLNAPSLSSPRFDITWNMNFLWNYDISQKIFLAFNYRHATGKPFTSGPLISDYNSSRIPNYEIANISFNYKILKKTHNPIIFFFTINNLLNKTNITDIKSNDDFTIKQETTSTLKRNFYFGVNYNYIF